MIPVFLDANVIVDFMDRSAKDHHQAYETIRIVRRHFGKPLVSPFTFLIANHLFSKHIKDTSRHREKMQLVFSGLTMTAIPDSFLNTLFNSRFIDLEDAAQYQCAMEGNAVLIITKDIHDFFASAIPVIHPLDFIHRYNSLV